MSAARRRERARLTGIFKRRHLLLPRSSSNPDPPTAVLFSIIIEETCSLATNTSMLHAADDEDPRPLPLSSSIIQRLVLIIADVGRVLGKVS